MLNGLKTPDRLAIIADIGGTHARFSCVDLNNLKIREVEVYACADFSSLESALEFYQRKKSIKALKKLALAIACPIDSDTISMTNFHWQFSIQELKARLALDELHVLNDFTAQALSLTALESKEKIQIGTGLVNEAYPKLVLGAGTGLGISHLIPSTVGLIPLPSEGGHASFSAQTEQEWFIQRFLAKLYSHVSIERILSGRGLETLYLALAAYHHKESKPLTAAEIAAAALNGSSTLALASVEQFLATLGSVAGDLALTTSCFGGVYLTGGIIPKLYPLLLQSDFRTRFEEKGRFKAFNQKIATFIVTASQPGLLGAAVFLQQIMAKNDA